MMFGMQTGRSGMFLWFALVVECSIEACIARRFWFNWVRPPKHQCSVGRSLTNIFSNSSCASLHLLALKNSTLTYPLQSWYRHRLAGERCESSGRSKNWKEADGCLGFGGCEYASAEYGGGESDEGGEGCSLARSSHLSPTPSLHTYLLIL